jgi:hypothetical protein
MRDYESDIQMPRSQFQSSLSRLWFRGSVIIHIALVVLSLAGKYGTRIEDILSICLPVALPTATPVLFVSMIKSDECAINRSLSSLILWLSRAYFIGVFVLIFLQPVSSLTAVQLYPIASFVLTPVSIFIMGGLWIANRIALDPSTVGHQARTIENHMPNDTKQDSVFISYAHEDNEKAEHLRRALQERGVSVWKDTNELLPGERWQSKIKQALARHDFVLLCFSTMSVRKTGFFQVEVKEAINWQNYRPESAVYIIPIRLDDCELPSDVSELQWVDMFEDWEKGIAAIMTTIQHYSNNT